MPRSDNLPWSVWQGECILFHVGVTNKICIQLKIIYFFILPWFASSFKSDKKRLCYPGIVAYENHEGNKQDGNMHDGEQRESLIPKQTHTRIIWTRTFCCHYVTSILCLQWPSTSLSCCLLHVCDIVCPWASGSVCSSVSVMYRCTHTAQLAWEGSASLERSFIIFLVKSKALVMRLMLSSTKQSWASKVFLAFI